MMRKVKEGGVRVVIWPTPIQRINRALVKAGRITDSLRRKSAITALRAEKRVVLHIEMERDVLMRRLRVIAEVLFQDPALTKREKKKLQRIGLKIFEVYGRLQIWNVTPEFWAQILDEERAKLP